MFNIILVRHLTDKIFYLSTDVSDKGVVRGQAVGTTRILAQAIGIHPSTGENVLYSEVSGFGS